MLGLPFDELPAHVVGRAVTADGRQVDLQRLGNMQTGRMEDVIVENGVVSPVGSRPEGHAGPWVTQAQAPSSQSVTGTPPIPQSTDDLAAMSDPVTLLTQQSSAALEQALATVKSKRGKLEKSIQPDREAAYRDYLIDFEVLNKSNMDAEQKKQRAQALYASYQKKAHGIRDGIRADLEALTQAEEQAKGKIELKRLTTQAQMQAIAAVGQEYGWSPYEVKRQQYKAMGMVLPAEEKPKELTPVERLGELNRYRSALEDTALRVRYNKSGQLEYDDSTTKTTNWQVVTDPARAAALEQTANTYLALGNEIERIAKEGGRKHVDLAAVSGRSAVPTPPGGGWSRGAIARKLFTPTAAYDYAKWAYGMSPLAKGVAQARNDTPPATRASADPNDVSRLSTEEIKARLARLQ